MIFAKDIFKSLSDKQNFFKTIVSHFRRDFTINIRELSETEIYGLFSLKIEKAITQAGI